MNNYAQPKHPAVIWIVLALFFFWPLGLFLLYQRLTCDKSNLVQRARIQKNFAIGFFIFSGLFLLVGMFGETANREAALTQMLIMVIILAVPAVILLVKSMKSKKLADRANVYCAQIFQQQTSDLNTLAAAAAVSTDQAAQDLQKMIYSGFFPGAFIDQTRHQIVMPGQGGGQVQGQAPWQGQGQPTMQGQPAMQGQAQNQYQQQPQQTFQSQGQSQRTQGQARQSQGQAQGQPRTQTQTSTQNGVQYSSTVTVVQSSVGDPNAALPPDVTELLNEVLPNGISMPFQTQAPAPTPSAPPQPAPPTTRTIACPSCGATSTVTTGVPSTCEYCGSPLNA